MISPAYRELRKRLKKGKTLKTLHLLKIIHFIHFVQEDKLPPLLPSPSRPAAVPWLRCPVFAARAKAACKKQTAAPAPPRGLKPLAKSRPLPLLRLGCFVRRTRLGCAVPRGEPSASSFSGPKQVVRRSCFRAFPYHSPSRVPRADLISVGIHDGILQPPLVDGCGLDQIPVLGIRYRNHHPESG